MSHGVDSAAERRVGNDPSLPDFSNQLVLGDNARAMADQIMEEVKNLGFDRNDIASAPQLTPLGVEQIIGKEVGQARSRGIAAEELG